MSSSAYAGGFNLDHQNAAAMGSAFAGAAATPSDSGFAAYNPASIAGIDRAEMSASITGVFPSVSYANANATLLGFAPVAGAPSGDTVVNDNFVPNISIAAPLNDRLTYGKERAAANNNFVPDVLVDALENGAESNATRSCATRHDAGSGNLCAIPCDHGERARAQRPRARFDPGPAAC